MLLILLLVGIALIGNLAIWTRAHCILHSMPWKQEAIDVIELFIYAVTLILPAYTAWWYFSFPGELDLSLPMVWVMTPLFYLPVCWMAVVFAFFFWWSHRNEFLMNQSNYQEKTLHFIDLSQQTNEPLIAHWKTKLLSKFPGNQILSLTVNRKELNLNQLPSDLEDFTITHLSDLHLTGHLTSAFYQQVIEQANQLQSDMIVISGDIFDIDSCVDWSAEIFGKLQAKHGVYFILGNHDKRLKDVSAARNTLSQLGLIDLGSHCSQIQLAETSIFLAGNEFPWFPSPLADEEFQPDAARTNQFRLLVSHTPDRIDWSAEYQFDLMLAGHNHGGQICLPVVGSLVSPSHHGVRFASGVFYSAPTLMHVSRGIAGSHQIRLNCSPELTQIVLKRKD
ncbi:MAG: metallophosphoesterase [Pirellulales bacterium]